MESSSQATPSFIAVGEEIDELMTTDDQCFLLYFIMGTYFGPDLKDEKPQKPVLQRQAEGLPSYTFDQLAGPHIKTVEIERVYYYILRKADQSVIVKPPQLHQFFRGDFPTLAYPQFSDLFPPHFHPYSQFENHYNIIQNIVFVNNPETFYIKPEDIERFKRLTGLEDFLLDIDGIRSNAFVDCKVLYDVGVQEVDFDGELLQQKDKNVPHYRAQNNGAPPVSVAGNGNPSSIEVGPEEFGSGIIFFPSRPSREEWNNIVAATKSGSVLTGTAASGHIGPVLGLMDIAECRDSYLFRVSLPGVMRDEREFSCEVESDGKVLIRGVTATGEKTVYRYSQVFEMQSQNLCPPGHFSISFKLPGPVDPQQFSGNFGTDGILEGIVMKEGWKRL